MKRPDLFRKDRRQESKEKVERKVRIETLYNKYTICQGSAKKIISLSLLTEEMNFFGGLALFG